MYAPCEKIFRALSCLHLALYFARWLGLSVSRRAQYCVAFRDSSTTLRMTGKETFGFIPALLLVLPDSSLRLRSVLNDG